MSISEGVVTRVIAIGSIGAYAIVIFAVCLIILRYLGLIGPRIDRRLAIEMVITLR